MSMDERNFLLIFSVIVVSGVVGLGFLMVWTERERRAEEVDRCEEILLWDTEMLSPEEGAQFICHLIVNR